MSAKRPTETATPSLPAGRRAVLYAVRRRGEATAEQVADQLGMTVSGARQHLTALGKDGLVESAELEPATAQRGRRTLVYAATAAADAYFPKAYGELTNELLGYVADSDPALLDVMFELPSRRDVTKCVITRETISKGLNPTLVTHGVPDDELGAAAETA